MDACPQTLGRTSTDAARMFRHQPVLFTRRFKGLALQYTPNKVLNWPFANKHSVKECAVSHKVSAAASSHTAAKPKAAAPKKATSPAQPVSVAQYRLVTSQREQVYSVIEKHQKHFLVRIQMQDSAQLRDQQLYLSWGAYRASAGKWFHPDSITPQGTELDPNNRKAKRSKFVKSSNGSKSSCLHSIEFEVPLQLAPVMLGFRLYVAGVDSKVGKYIGPASGKHFGIPVGFQKGIPLPQGPSVAAIADDGTCSLNFAVRSRHAASVSLCLVRSASGQQQSKGGFLEVALDPVINKTGDMWHVCLEGLKDVGSLCYGWRAEADVAWEGRTRFHPGQVMLDPYGPLVAAVTLPDNANLVAPKGGAAGSMPINTPQLTLSSLAFLLDDFSFQDVPSPRRSLRDTIVFELDVPTFTSGRQAQQEGVPTEHQGKILGVLDRLGHIKRVGATAVLLTPVVMTAEGNGPMGQAPMSFFAPNPSLAAGSGPLAASQELKHVIKQLHLEGIEVILQVEYCFTSEGTDKRPQASSLRGLDAATYYRHNGVLNCGHACVRQLILDSLHHWAIEYQVDGFCFVNAETLVQDSDGNILDNPPLADEIAQDGLLQGLKIIAWAADDSLLPRGGIRGFPHWGIWAERNKLFTADMMGLMAHCLPGMASKVATRITGSADLMETQRGEGALPGSLSTGRAPAAGLNAISAVGASGIVDLIAQVSANWTDREAGQEVTLAKSLVAASLLCQGTPIISQDVTSAPGMDNFVSILTRFRSVHAELLQPAQFESTRQLSWHGATSGSQPDWDGEAAANDYHAANYLGYLLQMPGKASIYIGYNPYSYPLQIDVPPSPEGHVWRQAIDTAEPAPLDAMTGPKYFPTLLQDDHYHVQARAIIALLSEEVKV